MALSRKSKIWLLIIGIPFVILIGGAIALKLYFTEERLKSMAIPLLEEKSGRSVSLQRVSLSVFPNIALEMDSIAIANRPGEGFSDRPILSLDRLVLDVRLWAILKGNLEVTTMELLRPRILLEVDTKGRGNYEPAPSSADTDGEVSTDAGGGSALFTNVRIIDGHIEYLNRKEDALSVFDGLAMTLKGELIPGEGEVRLNTSSTVDNYSYGSTSSTLISGLRLTSEQGLLYQPRKDLLTLEPGKLKVQDIELNVRGGVSDLSKMFMMDIALESENVNIAHLLSLVPPEYMKKAENLKGTGVAKIQILVTGTVNDSTKADLAGSILTTGASIQYAGLPKAITNVTIVSDFVRTKAKQQFTVSKFSALLGGNPVRATMQVVNFDDPFLTLAAFVELNLAEVKEYYPLETGTELKGGMKAQVNMSGKVNNPQAMKSSGTIEFQGVTIKTAGSDRPLQNLNGSVAFNNQILESKKLSMSLGSSDITLAFWLKNYLSLMSDDAKAPHPLANVSLTSNRLSTADLMGEEKSPKTEGKGGGKDAKGGGLPLPNVEMDVSATIGKLQMERFDLDNVRGTMKVVDGVITLQNFSCNTFGGSVISKGKVNMQNPDRPQFDLALDMNGLDANALLPKFTSFGQRLFGKLTMNTTLKGTLDDTLGLVAQALNGEGRVSIESGKVQGMKMNQELAGMLKLPDLEVINFKDWANSFSISDGKFVTKDLKISALGADYSVNGAYGLDGTLNYGLSVLLSEASSAKVNIPGFLGEAVNLFKDESGRVKLDFAVSGTQDSPKLALDTQSAQRRAEDIAKQKINAEKKKLEDELKKKGGDLLKDLLKGGKK